MILEEIEKAKALYESYRSTLLDEKRIGELLETYRRAIARTYKAMAEEGVLKVCSECAQGPAGSCCFEGVEAWYDRCLLLINLLLGVEIPGGGAFPGHCRFVGERGCRLVARYAFCVNYLCPALQEALGPQGCGTLSSIVGAELASGIQVEHHLFKWIVATESTVKASRA